MTAKRMTMAGAIACALALGGCADDRGSISQVQTNVVSKDIFDGSWYISSTVIDVDYEASSLGTYEGDSADDWSLTNNPWNQRAINYNIARIRWVIDENFLYAYRDYELVQMTQDDGDPAGEPTDPTKLGEPLAVYAIESHFDLQRAYNPTTGEEMNVLTENATDKRWYERKYMRVDWSQNLSTSYLFGTRELYELFGYFRREPAGFQLEEGSIFPESWKPTFRRNSCAGWDDTSEGCEAQDRDHAGDYAKDELYYMSFVNQEIFTPGDVPDPFGRGIVPWCASVYGDAPQCTSNLVTVRYSFLKRSPLRQYDPLDYPDETHHGHFAYFRNERPVFDQSSDPGDPQREVTDAWNTTINRHNIWRQWFDADGNRLPYTDRDIRPIAYYTTSDMPYHQIKSSFQIASDWNVIFMEMVRRLRGIDLPADGNGDGKPDYDAWNHNETNSYDCHIVNHAPGGAMTDAREADPTEEEYAQRQDSGDAIHDADFADWRYTEMVGSECVVQARVNSCIREGTNPVGCEERGDSRYKFISYIQQPGTPFLGVATMRGDPLTGEIITGDANIGGPALDGYRTLAMEYIDLAAGNITAEEYLTGENVRDYFERLGRVERPAMPITDFQVAAMSKQDAFAGLPGMENERFRNIFREAAARTAPLRSRDRLPLPGVDMRRRLLESPEGQRLNRALTDNDETLALNGIVQRPTTGASLTDDFVMELSPLVNDVATMDRRQKQRALQYSLRTMEFGPPGYDWSIVRYVDQHRDWPRARIAIELSRQLFIGTESHELGHCLGMRHQFGASADWRNYDDAYYQIAEENPWPLPIEFDDNSDGVVDAQEERNYQEEYLAVKEARDRAGIAAHTASSTMEYTADWYEDENAMGKFDKAAMLFGYGEMAEVYANSDNAAPDEIDPRERRDVWRFFSGGEPCETDAECPFNGAGSRGDELIQGQIEQSCVPNPVHPGGSNICSNFWDALASQNAGGDLSYVPVRYNSCEDLVSSTNSEPGCMPFDRGASFTEVVNNFRERYDRDYLRNNFRRYRRTFSVSSYYGRVWGRNLGLMRDLYGNLWNRYAYDPDFLNDDGPFGFIDQYAASVDIMNFFAQIVSQPDIGSYRWNENRQLYTHFDEFPDNVSAQLSLDLGLAKHPYSTYQDGLTGISKLEKIGIFYDRVWALEAMLVRYWGDDFGTDLTSLTNFYDLFPNELSQLLSGIIRDEPREYGPRVYCEDGGQELECVNPHLQYVDWYRGDCVLGIGSGACRPDPVRVTYAGMDGIDFGASFLSRIYATLFGLMEIPVWYDTSFVNQLDICIEGQGDCFGIRPEMVPCDLDPSSGTYDPDCENSDFVRFSSDEFHRNWVALNVDVAPNSSISEQTIGFDLVREAANASFGWRRIQRALDAGQVPPGFSNTAAAEDERDRLQSRASSLESFMGQILEWQRIFGINYAP